MQRYGNFEVKKAKGFNEKGLYTKLAEHSEKVAYIPSHRFLAIMRAVKEKELSVKISIDTSRIEENIKTYKIPKHASSHYPVSQKIQPQSRWVYYILWRLRSGSRQLV